VGYIPGGADIGWMRSTRESSNASLICFYTNVCMWLQLASQIRCEVKLFYYFCVVILLTEFCIAEIQEVVKQRARALYY
jgi:hypothetical protein